MTEVYSINSILPEQLLALTGKGGPICLSTELAAPLPCEVVQVPLDGCQTEGVRTSGRPSRAAQDSMLGLYKVFLRWGLNYQKAGGRWRLNHAELSLYDANHHC